MPFKKKMKSITISWINAVKNTGNYTKELKQFKNIFSFIVNHDKVPGIPSK